MHNIIYTDDMAHCIGKYNTDFTRPFRVLHQFSELRNKEPK